MDGVTPYTERAQPSPSAGGRTGALSRGGPILSRARLALAFKMACAGILTGSMLLSELDVYVSLALALLFIVLTVALDYWVYRAVDTLFRRLQAGNRESEDAQQGGDAIHEGLTDLMTGVVDSFTSLEGVEVETVRSDLYRLRNVNNQLIRLGEIAQELNAALPYRETKTKALDLSRRLLSADIAVLLAEQGGEFTLEGVAGCEEGEIKVGCCSYYARCPMRSSFRDCAIGTTRDHQCGMFPPTMRSQVSLPFKLNDRVTLSLVAAAAQPDAFVDLSPVVLNTLLGHIQTSLATAQKYDGIRREVVTDPLTNLYNRRFFEKRAEEEVARSLRHQAPLTLLMVDVDHFKHVNDTYGHPTGDKVLQSVAKFLHDSVRQTDICGRYGGEEFILLLPNTPGRNAVFLADRLRAGVADIMYSGLGIPGDKAITISGGVATCPRDATNLDDLVRRADEALYEAKRAGRNCIVQAGIPDPPLNHAEVPPATVGPSPATAGYR
jgi:diguanylate cyclase (GGDEF) domain